MLKRFKRLNSNERGMIIFVIVLLFGIFLRWGYVKQNAQHGFDKYFNTEGEAKR